MSASAARGTTHYDTLEVSPAASPETIRAAYRSLMQRFHPDRHPGDEGAARRAAEISRAYDVLSDPGRRAAYDASLRRTPPSRNAPAGAAAQSPHAPHPARARAGAGRGHAAGESAGWGGAFWVGLIVVAIGVGGWLATRSFRTPDPRAQLLALRTAFQAPDASEAIRRELHAKRTELVGRHPELQTQESLAAQADAAARGARLLAAPLVVNIEARGETPAAQLTIPAIQLQVGAFESRAALAHLERHRERVLQELAERLARLDVARLRTPAAAQILRESIVAAVARSLGTDPSQDFPSTWHETPGRHGVTAASLPEGFSLQAQP